MQIGAVFPQTELGGDRGAVRAYAQTVEQLGYTHLLAYDHVVGADPAVHEGWIGELLGKVSEDDARRLTGMLTSFRSNWEGRE